MSKPIVAIVGRPNVGKSTLFNKLIGERRSIVEDIPGVTRDRIYAEAEWNDHRFILIDTGGIEPKSDDTILKQMRMQAEIAIASASVIIFMCDIRAGLLAEIMKKTNFHLLDKSSFFYGCGDGIFHCPDESHSRRLRLRLLGSFSPCFVAFAS